MNLILIKYIDIQHPEQRVQTNRQKHTQKQKRV